MCNFGEEKKKGFTDTRLKGLLLDVQENGKPILKVETKGQDLFTLANKD